MSSIPVTAAPKSLFTIRVAGQEFTVNSCGDALGRVPGLANYATLPATEEGDDRTFRARLEHAYKVATPLQAAVAAQASADGTWTAASATEDELTAILGDRLNPISLDGEWSHSVPLILIATDYSPYSDLPVPSGNVTLLDPSDELMYLRSLDELGVIEFIVNDEDPATW